MENHVGDWDSLRGQLSVLNLFSDQYNVRIGNNECIRGIKLELAKRELEWEIKQDKLVHMMWR